jgi:hypothetical protein
MAEQLVLTEEETLVFTLKDFLALPACEDTRSL